MLKSALTSSGFTSLCLAVFLSPEMLTAKVFSVDGIVISLDHAEKTMVVSHRPISKLMPAMVMPFRVENPAELNGLHPGSRVQFDLVINEDRSLARRIRVTGEKDLDIPIPKDRKQVGDLIPDFTLTDQQGRPVHFSELRGKTVVVNFIYTRCPLPDVCPRLSANFAVMQRRFRARLGKDLVLLSVTIDPQNDTPEVLNEYAARWGADSSGWKFLTGDPAAIANVAGNFGLVYWPDEGSLGHNATTTIIHRDGRVAAIVEGSSFRVDQLGDLIARQLEASQ
jgi:protein SCO1/2